jgi:hypothetical protein
VGYVEEEVLSDRRIPRGGIGAYFSARGARAGCMNYVGKMGIVKITKKREMESKEQIHRGVVFSYELSM